MSKVKKEEKEKERERERERDKERDKEEDGLGLMSVHGRNYQTYEELLDGLLETASLQRDVSTIFTPSLLPFTPLLYISFHLFSLSLSLSLSLL